MAVRTASFEIAAFESDAPKNAQRFVELQHGGGRFSLWRAVTRLGFDRPRHAAAILWACGRAPSARAVPDPSSVPAP